MTVHNHVRDQGFAHYVPSQHVTNGRAQPCMRSRFCVFLLFLSEFLPHHAELVLQHDHVLRPAHCSLDNRNNDLLLIQGQTPELMLRNLSYDRRSTTRKEHLNEWRVQKNMEETVRFVLKLDDDENQKPCRRKGSAPSTWFEA